MASTEPRTRPTTWPGSPGGSSELDELERAVLFTDTWASILVGRSEFADLFTLGKGLADLDEPSSFDVVARPRSPSRTASSTTRAATRSPARSARCGARSSPGSGGSRARGEAAQAAELRADGHPPARHARPRRRRSSPRPSSRFDAERVTGDLADAIVAITLGQGRPGDVATCRARASGGATPQDEQRYLFAPAESPDPAIVLEIFERAFAEVRTQDAPYLDQLAHAEPRGRPTGLEGTAPAGGTRRSSASRTCRTSAMIVSVTTFVSDPALAAEVRRFHEDHPVPMGQQQVAQILDLMDLHVSLASEAARRSQRRCARSPAEPGASTLLAREGPVEAASSANARQPARS